MSPEVAIERVAMALYAEITDGFPLLPGADYRAVEATAVRDCLRLAEAAVQALEVGAAWDARQASARVAERFPAPITTFEEGTQ